MAEFPNMRHRIVLSLFLTALALALPARAAAQRVYWNAEPGTLGVGKTSDLRLVFEDCRPTEAVRLPAVDGLRFGTPSTAQETSIINFKMSQRTVLTYPVQAERRGTFVIPAFDVRTNIGAAAVGEIRLAVGEANVGGGSVSVADIIETSLRPSRPTLWAGEVSTIDYVLAASPQYNTSLGSTPDWTPGGLVIEPFGEPARSEERVRGERWSAVRYSTRFIAPNPGRFVLDPVHQTIRIQTGERAGFFFSQPRVEEFIVASDQPEINVRPLPAPPAGGFSGAVGTFTLESTVVPQNARVGEPVTWTLKLSGTGNWPVITSLPEREVSADFEVIQPKSRQAMEPNQLFTGSLTEDAVLVPTQAGTYTIGPVRFTYFDTESGTYRTLNTGTTRVTIHAGAPAQPTPAVDPAPSAAAPSSSATPGDPAALPPLPGDRPEVPALPREPLPTGAAPGRAPSAGSAALWFWLALIPPVLVWVGLAWFRAWRDDASRVRHAARAELARLLRRLERNSGSPDAASLEGWRTFCARMWGIRRAVPTADQLAAAIARHGGTSDPEAWLTLWREAESALFSANQPLPSDWTGRTSAILRQTRVLRVEPAFPHRLRHWAPYSTLLALAFLLAATQPAGAADPREAYRDGRFAEARAAWMEELRTAPDDWTLHNNIALTFAQQERWPEAAAHWSSAFLLNPRSEDVRLNLRLGLSRLDRIDPALRRLVDGSHLDRAVHVLSPAEWQRVQFAGIAVAALGLTAIVIAFYRPRGRAWRWAGSLLVFGGVAALGAGIESNRLYGPLADPAVALVIGPTTLRSIPTDLADSQQTAPIAPGTVVTMHKSFLSWRQVSAGRDTMGWIRRDACAPLYPSARPNLDAPATRN